MTQFTRKEGWELRYLEALRPHLSAPFAYGQSDCFGMAMDAVEAVTGVRPYADDRGAYTTAKGAAKRMQAKGFADLVGAMDALFPRVDLASAHRGDLACVITSDGPGLAVVIGADVIGKGERGIVRQPRADAQFAWKVG